MIPQQDLSIDGHELWTAEPWEQAPARIKVIGVGGGGCNCVRRMAEHDVRGVRYVMVNTDIKALMEPRPGVEIIQIGVKSTRGWGAGGDASAGLQAAEESASEVREALRDAELVFITSGMGGGTGTGAAPFVAHIAKEMGALVVGVVTTPFSFEGRRRIGQAMAGVKRLRPYVDNLIVIHNDRLLRYVSQDAEMYDCIQRLDRIFLLRGHHFEPGYLLGNPGICHNFQPLACYLWFPGNAMPGALIRWVMQLKKCELFRIN